MKQRIRINENQLKRIVSESVKRILNEVAIKGKSGKTYSLHGTDPESWGIMQRLRYLNGNNIPNGTRDEDNFIELDDKAHPNPRSRNNAKRIDAMFNRMWGAGDDIQAARQMDESKIKKAIKESVKRVLNEGDDEFTPHGYMTKSNLGGTEVQISNDGSSARFRNNYGTPDEPTDWLEIEFDEDGVAYVTLPNGGQERLDNYMRY